MKKIKKILISQPKPSNELSPYSTLQDKLKVAISFTPLIQIEGLSAAEVRRNKINVRAFSHIIFTSKNAIDHYFRIIKETHYELPSEAKFFCITDSVSNYLQNHIIVKKRNVLTGKYSIEDLKDVILRHKEYPFLLPSSKTLNEKTTSFLNGLKIHWRKGTLYKTVPVDLQGISPDLFDMIVLFTPGDVDSLFHNFPDFEQNEIKIATFGSATQAVAEDKNLSIDIVAPSEKWKSMSTALDKYITKHNALKK